MSVKFLGQGNNGLPLMGYESMRLAIISRSIIQLDCKHTKKREIKQTKRILNALTSVTNYAIYGVYTCISCLLTLFYYGLCFTFKWCQHTFRGQSDLPVMYIAIKSSYYQTDNSRLIGN
jgi:hypothetical protein